ncbi:YceI family protein [Reyranella massiliensis]|uniref:YceI family protein n=1 Tax=Reyranella massiliensis TaxID=445220 RepID=UPI001C07CAC0|nr:YceI family protein [Reyranella massiliensis]
MPTRFLGLFVVAAATLLSVAGQSAWAAEDLKIGGNRGTMEFAIGDSRIFRTTGGFQTWQGNVQVNDADMPKSAVEVTVQTDSLKMMDRQQADMLKDSDFFDVDRFPQMTFRSEKVQRTGTETLKIDGFLTLRGVTRPMTLDVTVSDRKPNAAPGARYARVRAKGTIKRSDFGMTKYVDLVGDNVEISITTDAWR